MAISFHARGSAAAFEDFINQHCGGADRSGADAALTVLSHDIVTVLNTGTAIDPERWRERKAREKELLDQTDRLADLLEQNGIPARTKNDSIFAIGLVTGDIDQLPHFRSICFLPAVAKRERAPFLNELRFFRKTHPRHRKYMRLAVVTCGPRITAGSDGELREALQQLHRDLSRWNQWASQKFGIEVIGRFSEITVRDDGNCRTVHPHANVLMTPRKLLSKKEWTSFLRETKERFGFWWSDQGRLKKPEEAIKYVCKPADLDALSESEIVWLFNELYGLKLVHPMGPFRDWRRETLCERREPGSGWYKARKVVSVDLGGRPQLRVGAKKKRGHRIKSRSKTTTELRTCLLGITLPQRRASPWAEPCALVSTALNPVALGHQAFVKEWEEETLFGDSNTEQLQEYLRARDVAKVTWRANGAPDPETAVAVGRGCASALPERAATAKPFIVHTYRSTARGEDITAHLQDLEACLRETERITTTYSDLILGEDEDAEDEFGDSDLSLEEDEDAEDELLRGFMAITSIPSQIAPLATVADWSP